MIRELKTSLRKANVETRCEPLLRQRYSTLAPTTQARLASDCVGPEFGIHSPHTETDFQRQIRPQPDFIRDWVTAYQTNRTGFHRTSDLSTRNAAKSEPQSKSASQGSCIFPRFRELSLTQQNLLGPQGGERLFESTTLTDKQKACFLNITAALDWLRITIDNLVLKSVDQSEQSGIQVDQLLLEPTHLDDLQRQVEYAIQNKKILGDRGFIYDKPDKDHQGMNDWGARQLVTRESLQVGIGKNGAFIDIDRFGPRTDLVGLFGHIFGEVIPHKITHGKTDPFAVGKGLRKRGIDIRYICK